MNLNYEECDPNYGTCYKQNGMKVTTAGTKRQKKRLGTYLRS